MIKVGFIECPICKKTIPVYQDLEFENVGIAECKDCKQGFGIDIQEWITDREEEND